MLFLPIDHPSKPRRPFLTKRADNKISLNSSIKRRPTTTLKQRPLQITTSAIKKASGSGECGYPAASRQIRDTSCNANSLIHFMRQVQYGTQPSSLKGQSRPKQQQRETTGGVKSQEMYGLLGGQSVSPQRVMTTMSTCTKERLRKNLESFSSDRPRSILKEKPRYMVTSTSPSLIQTALPQHTQNAYRQSPSETKQLFGARKVSTPLSHGMIHQTQNAKNLTQSSGAKLLLQTTFDGSILPYTKHCNDETNLYRLNAAKPLFDEGRTAHGAQRRIQASTKVGPVRPTISVAPARGAAMQNTTSSRNLSSFDHSKRRTSAHSTIVSSQPRQKSQSTLLTHQQPQRTAGQANNKTSRRSLLSHTPSVTLNSTTLATNARKANNSSAASTAYGFTATGPHNQAKQMTGTLNTRAKELSTTGQCQHSAFGRSTSQTPKQEYLDEPPFTVKLCVKCSRSIKLRNHSNSGTTTAGQQSKARSKRMSGTKRTQSVQHSQPIDDGSHQATLSQTFDESRAVSQFTQVDFELGSRYRNQRQTQTQSNGAADAYTQSELVREVLKVENGTMVSQNRFCAEKEDQMVQTSQQAVIKDSKRQRRPQTGNFKVKGRKTSQTVPRRTYNMVNSAASRPEHLNGRKFVIYSRDQYENFLGSKKEDECAFETQGGCCPEDSAVLDKELTRGAMRYR